MRSDPIWQAASDAKDMAQAELRFACVMLRARYLDDPTASKEVREVIARLADFDARKREYQDALMAGVLR